MSLFDLFNRQPSIPALKAKLARADAEYSKHQKHLTKVTTSRLYSYGPEELAALKTKVEAAKATADALRAQIERLEAGQ